MIYMCIYLLCAYSEVDMNNFTGKIKLVQIFILSVIITNFYIAIGGQEFVIKIPFCQESDVIK